MSWVTVTTNLSWEKNNVNYGEYELLKISRRKNFVESKLSADQAKNEAEQQIEINQAKQEAIQLDGNSYSGKSYQWLKNNRVSKPTGEDADTSDYDQWSEAYSYAKDLVDDEKEIIQNVHEDYNAILEADAKREENFLDQRQTIKESLLETDKAQQDADSETIKTDVTNTKPKLS